MVAEDHFGTSTPPRQKKKNAAVLSRPSGSPSWQPLAGKAAQVDVMRSFTSLESSACLSAVAMRLHAFPAYKIQAAPSWGLTSMNLAWPANNSKLSCGQLRRAIPFTSRHTGQSMRGSCSGDVLHRALLSHSGYHWRDIARSAEDLQRQPSGGGAHDCNKRCAKSLDDVRESCWLRDHFL